MWKLTLVPGLILLIALVGCIAEDKSPGGVYAKQVAGGIEIGWSPVKEVIGYNIYRSTAVGVLGSKLNPSPITGMTNYKDTSVSDGVTYFYTVKSVDSGGNEYGEKQVSAAAKTMPPQGSQIVISSGADYATDTRVTLSLYSVGASECRFSNDGSTWSDWEPYSTSRVWQLPVGDGSKEVYFQCKDSVGNIAAPVSASIVLDTTAPALSITSPVSGQQYGGSFDLVFTVSDAKFPSVECSANVDGNAVQIGVVQTLQQIKINVPAKSGAHTLYLECSDKAGLKASQSVSFTTTDKPSVSIILGDGSGYTDSRKIRVEIDATNAQFCRLSDDGVVWYDWMPYTKYTQWTTTPGDGKKYVYAQCKSAQGQVSDISYDTIILDTSPPPYISVHINNDDSWTRSRNVRLGLYAFAAAKCRLANEDKIWSDWMPYTRSIQWVLSPGQGIKRVYYNCLKSTGEDVGTATASIEYSDTPPNPPAQMRILINGGAKYTTSRDVMLTLSASYAASCRYQEDNSGWSDWEGYATSRKITIASAGDGIKTIYYQCKNDYGISNAQASIYLDENPPHRVTDLRAEATPTSIYLKWTPVGDESSGVAGYNIYRSNVEFGLIDKIGSATSSSYTDYKIASGSTYMYIVRAVDFAGRESEDSNPVTVQAKGAGQVSVQILSPRDGEQAPPPVVLQFIANDNMYNTVSCNYYLNGKEYPAGKVQVAQPHAEPLNLDPGMLKYILSVICTNDGGGAGNSGNIVFYQIPENAGAGVN